MAKKKADDEYESDEGYFKQDAPPPVPVATGDTRPPSEAETAVHQPYPARRYAYGQPVMVVENADEDAALGTGWSKSPEALITPPPEPEVDPIPTSKAKDAKEKDKESKP